MHCLIKNIYWKRTCLYIEYEPLSEIQLFLKDKTGAAVWFQQEADGLAKLNICTAHGNKNLKDGKYRIFAAWRDNDAGETVQPEIAPAALRNLENFARVFRYNEDDYAYIISFLLDGKRDYALTMEVNYMMKNKSPEKSRPFLERKSMKGFIKRLISNMFETVCRLLYTVFSIGKGEKGDILIMSENRKELSENLSAIDVRLKERGLDKRYKIRYSLRNSVKTSYPLTSWVKVVYQIARSRYIFIDDYTPVFAIIKLRNTKLVQLWHAGVGFKLVGYARFGIAGSPHPFKSCHRHYSYGVVGCEALREVYSEVWGIEPGKIIASGLPRLDHFLDSDRIQKETERLEQKYKLFKNKKIILFAPTYRGNGQSEAFYDYSKIDFDALYRYGVENNGVIFFKMHHFIQEPVPIDEAYKDVMIEVKDESINSLYYIADVLITDYSSCFYDYTLLKKPILFYAYDKEEYYATRGVHLTLEEMAPGKICEDFSSLLASLTNEEYEMEKLDRYFVDRAALQDGLASDMIIDRVIRNGAVNQENA